MNLVRTRLALAALGMAALAFGQIAQADTPDAGKSFDPVAVRAAPNLRCKVYTAGDDASKAREVVSSDPDGYVRFYAAHASAGDADGKLTLDCQGPDGAQQTYPVDLSAADPFASHPLDLESLPGADRPALTGDPMSYSPGDLVAQGYGMRPDPQATPQLYALWLKGAQRAGRRLAVRANAVARPAAGHNKGPTGLEWTGSVLTGAPDYEFSLAMYNVPKPVPNKDHLAIVSVWNGMGGYSSGGGLIQGGYWMWTTANAYGFSSFREYCCGDPDSNTYLTSDPDVFAPKPGDNLISEQWYCDTKGKLDEDKAYGCSFLMDVTTGAIFDCTNADDTVCASVKPLPRCTPAKTTGCMVPGGDADFIIEVDPENDAKGNQILPLTPVHFDGAIRMSGAALSSKTKAYMTVKTDPSAVLLPDGTISDYKLLVDTGAPDETCWKAVKSDDAGGKPPSCGQSAAASTSNDAGSASDDSNEYSGGSATCPGAAGGCNVNDTKKTADQAH